MERRDKPDLELRSLDNFHGSENYYHLMGGFNATDGVYYIMENGYSYFVTDSIAVLKAHPRLKQYLSGDDFVVVKLQPLPDKQAQMILPKL